MASTIKLLLAFLVLAQFSSAHRIEIITTTRPDGVFPEFDCNKPADIVFILDGSRIIAWKDFSKQVDFVKRFIDDIDVSKDIVRVGVATISTELRVDFSLNSYERKGEIKEALTNITDPKGRSHTWLALEYLRTKAFRTENGGRIGVPQIAIILTDNLSANQEKTVSEARLLHQEQIRVYVIAIDHFNMKELQEIASKPDNVYISSDMEALKDLEAPLRENICKIVCGTTPLDVIFVLDQSTNLWNEDIEYQYEFVDRFIKDSLIGSKHTQVGLVTFNTNVTNRFYLNQHQRMVDMLNAIKGLKRNYGESYTDRALRFISDQGFSEDHGARKGVPHVVILITDGQSSSPIETRKAADELQKSGTTVFVIGVGSGVDVNELQIIAGKRARLFQILSFRALKSMESPIFTRICTLRHTTTRL